MVKLRNGHAPGHVRDTFRDAIEAYMNWEAGQPEPTVDFEIGYVPRPITLSQACGLVWNCTDVIPGAEFRELSEGADLEIGRQTYAACARAILASIKGAAA